MARSTPIVGEFIANLLRGGSELGALTLGRWYAGHVFALPAVLVAFVVAHIYLMRRHGISGPLRPGRAPARAFFPWHVMKDTVVMALVFSALLAMAYFVRAPLDEVANPTDATYIPRPEWYFLSLFQLLKYFPGPLEPIATQVLPGLAVGFLGLLPFLDRHPERRPWAKARLPFSAAMLVLGATVMALTLLGLKDTPDGKQADDWGLLPIAGLELATGENSGCVRCHVPGGPAAPLSTTGLRRDEEWLVNHMIDPVAIAPGVRTADDRAPRSAMGRFGAQAVVAYLRRNHAGLTPPPLEPGERLAAMTYASTCVVCHRISGEGGTVGPDLTRIGGRRDAAGIRAVIEDPDAVYGESAMPAFKGKLTGTQIEALAQYLAARK